MEYNSVSHADLRVLFPGQNGPGSPGQSSPLAYSLAAGLQGETVLTTLQSGVEGVQVFQVFRNPVVRVVINGQEQPQQASEVARELERGFLLEMSPEGQINAIYMQAGAGGFSQDFARTVLAVLQFVFPTEPPANGQSWTVQEEDRTGLYLARYRIVSASVPGHRGWIELLKSKLRYLPETPEPAAQDLPGRTQTQKKVVPQMDLKARFDLESGRLASLRGTETQDTLIQGKTVAHSETTLRLVRLSSETVPAIELNRLRKLSTWLKENSPLLALFTRRSRQEIESNIQRSELGTATLQELMEKLKALGNTSLDPDKQQAAETPVYLKFKAMVYLHPESCTQLEKTLIAAETSSPAFRIVSGALGAVGHHQAQAALAHAIQARPNDTTALPALIAALGGVPQPTPETESAVRAVAVGSSDPNISGAAILALGSMAKNLAGKAPKRAAGIVDFLMQRAEASRSEEETQHLLRALGNTASSRALPLLERFAAAPSPALRAAAVDALRFITLPQVDELLRHALAADQDARVRLEAAFALGFRKPSIESFEAQKKQLAAESDEKVRVALLNNLAKMVPQFPSARSVLEHSAANDPSDYVRKVAAGLLQQMGGSERKPKART